MDVSSNTPYEAITIGGVPGIKVPRPFEAGPTELSEGQAHALNQVLAENYRNNLREKSKGKSVKEIQVLVDEYTKNYEFGKRSGGGRITDPIEACAMDLARRAVKKALVKQGAKVADIKSSQVSDLAKQLLGHETRGATIRKRAKKMVDDEAKDAEDLLSSLE